MKNLLLFLFLIISNISISQCACVWMDASGNVQCYLYSNCSNTNFTACADKVTNGTMCPCYVWPGMNPNVCGGCQPNGACWYNGNTCDANLVCNFIALPVELIDFYGNIENGVNTLNWSTATEHNSSHFIIDYSNDGYVFELLAQIPSAGNSTSKINYRAEHVDPKEGINYYRLTQVDFDGVREVFKIVSIDNSEEKRTIVRTVNLMGQDVDEYYKGFIVNLYSDGTTKRELK